MEKESFSTAQHKTVFCKTDLAEAYRVQMGKSPALTVFFWRGYFHLFRSLQNHLNNKIGGQSVKKYPQTFFQQKHDVSTKTALTNFVER